MIYIMYFLLAYGISNMLVYANGPFHIFELYRDTMSKIHPQLDEMVHCMICTPTWVGLFLSIINYFFITTPFTPFNIILHNSVSWYWIILFDGGITSGTVWLIHTLQEYFENNSEEIIEE